MTIGELKSSTIFHVINARTSYGLLLGRPWIYANGVVPSTLHQCLKFYREGVKVIYGDTKPFTEAESYFADAKFYMDEDMVSELFQKRSNPWAKQHLKSRSGKPCPRSKKKKLCHLQAKTTMSLLNLQQPEGVGCPQMDQTYPFSDTSRRQEERMVNPCLKLQQAKSMHSSVWIM
ncbi:hypothetical protein EV1_039864 [Malus domestica]